MSNAVRTTVNLGTDEWEFVETDAKSVLDTDDYKGPEDFNFSKYVRRLITERKQMVKARRKKKAA